MMEIGKKLKKNDPIYNLPSTLTEGNFFSENIDDSKDKRLFRLRVISRKYSLDH